MLCDAGIKRIGRYMLFAGKQTELRLRNNKVEKTNALTHRAIAFIDDHIIIGFGFPRNRSAMTAALFPALAHVTVPLGNNVGFYPIQIRPMTDPVIKVAKVPATRAFGASAITSWRRSGASAVSPPITMPRLAKFANPHMA